ncbi:MAG: translation elongation factor Ts [Caldilineaceae bacterium]
MAEITADMVKRLREETNAGVLDCKKALTENNGDFAAAAEFLRKKGLAKAASKSSRAANEGIIGSYIHSNSKMAALVRLNCETDFVARNEAFTQLARDIAMHIVASRPTYVSRELVPAEVLDAKKDEFRSEAAATGKPAEVIEKIIDGKLEKWYVDVCLVEQPYVRNPDVTVGSLLTDAIAKMGENIKVGAFSRLEIGE